MRKIVLIICFIFSIIGFSKTVVTGVYHTKGAVYTETEIEVLKNIKLNNFTVDAKDKVVAKFDDFEITLSKTELINEYNNNRKHSKISKLKDVLTKKEIDKMRIDGSISALIVKNRASIYDVKNKQAISNVVAGRGFLSYFYDRGNGSKYPYSGIFTTDLKRNIMSAAGDISHFYISNVYIKVNPDMIKYYTKYKEKKALYEKSKANPEVEHSFSY